MKTIIVGFSHSTKWFSPFSKAIQIWDGTNYSHVYFQFESSKYHFDMIYQSSSTMLNYMSKDVFLMHNQVRDEFSLSITEAQYDALMENCMKSAGLPYGVLEILGIVLAGIFKLKKNVFANKDKYICSEWVAEQLTYLGYTFDKELDLIKPSDVYKVLSNSSKAV